MLSVVGFTVASFLCGLAPYAAVADRVSRRAGRCRRSAAAAFAGGAAGGLPAAGARQGHGVSGASVSWWRRCSARCWAAGSPTTTAGAGSSTSMFRSASASILMTQPSSSIRLTSAAASAQASISGASACWPSGHRRAADRARQRPGGGLVRLAFHCGSDASLASWR